MKKMNKKKQKKVIRAFISEILGNMSFRDRIRFVFTGNYMKPLERTMKIHRMENLMFVRGASNKESGETPEIQEA